MYNKVDEERPSYYTPRAYRMYYNKRSFYSNKLNFSNKTNKFIYKNLLLKYKLDINEIKSNKLSTPLMLNLYNNNKNMKKFFLYNREFLELNSFNIIRLFNYN